jgi:septal ring factor EnvC (AmiA/AmiB activator)
LAQRFAIIFSLFVFLLCSAWPENTFASKADRLKKQIADSKNQMAAVGRREKKVLDEYNDAEFKLNQARLQVRAARSALDQIQAKIERIQQQQADLELKRKTNAAYVSQRLTALYKLGWSGRMQLLAGADSVFDFIIRKSALERILAQDERMWTQLRADQTELENIKQKVIAALSEKQALEKTRTEQVARLGSEQKQRSRLLQQIRKEKALGLAALEALRQAASELDAQVAALKQTPPPAAPAPRTKPLVDAARPVDRKKTEKSFGAYKGLLSWPVKGKVIARFGPYRDKKYNVENFRSGINIQAERGEPIRAVAGGETIYSNWFKGFGNMLIIDHGDHYYTVYAHLEEVFKTRGDRVEPNEVVATVGDSGSLEGPVLHFEVRHHGKPSDPLAWMKKG